MTTPDAQFAVSTDNTQIAWYDFGGSGPDMLLAHASGFCAPMWEDVAQHLTNHFHCVGYDSRGHGRSGRPDYGQEGWNWERFGEDVGAVIAAAGLNNPCGVGHSSGGASEILHELQHPGTFCGLYLFEPVVFANEPPRGPWPERELAVRTRKRRAAFASSEEALHTFSSRGPFATLTPRALRHYVEDGFIPSSAGITLRCRPDDEAEVYAMATAHDAYERLRNLACPVALGHGELSSSFTEAEVQHLADCIPGGAFVEFDGLGHFGPLENPSRFAESVENFFLP